MQSTECRVLELKRGGMCRVILAVTLAFENDDWLIEHAALVKVLQHNSLKECLRSTPVCRMIGLHFLFQHDCTTL